MKLSSQIPKRPPWRRGVWPYGLAASAIAIMTGIISITHADANLVSIPPLFLLAVQAIALLVGSRPAILAAILAFFSFDWFFVEPKHQLTVRDPFEFIALCVFLVTAIVVGQLTARAQRRAQESRERELAATALSKASWTVASEPDRDTALQKVLEQLTYVPPVKAAAISLDTKTFIAAAKYGQFDEKLLSAEAVQFVMDTKERIGFEGIKHWNKALCVEHGWQPMYLPIMIEGQLLGVLFLSVQADEDLDEQEKQVVNSLVNHIAIVIQRDHLIAEQAKTQALAEANRLKSALLQMVSHDLRSPLASIKASVSSVLIDEGTPVDNETLHGLLQAIDQETDRLNRMVGNVLDLSRLESDAWTSQREQISFGELIGMTLDSFNQQQNERVTLDVEANVKDVYVDSVQIVQVLRNLIENALKYSEGLVEAKVQEEDMQYLRIEIQDRGPGLPAGDESLIFEPFYRAPEHQESSRPGMGLGLAICRGLVEVHGGKLTAANRTGGGSIFTVLLPHVQSMVRAK